MPNDLLSTVALLCAGMLGAYLSPICERHVRAVVVRVSPRDRR